jgi:phosphoribosylamine--glycine ligase
MLTSDGPKLIEFNARFGDPETQAVLVRLESDLVEIFNAVIDGRISSTSIEWSADSSVCVVAASGGYPGFFEKGKPITGLDKARSVEGVVVFIQDRATNRRFHHRRRTGARVTSRKHASPAEAPKR